MSKEKYLVTGGAGFIGSHLVDKLLSVDKEVIVLDNFSSGKKENLEKHKRNKHLKVYEEDVCEKRIRNLFEGVSTIFHLAALPKVQFSIDYPEKTNSINLGGTLNVLDLAYKYRVRQVVYSSSSAIYGDQGTFPLTEETSPNPLSPYALQKLSGEGYCKLYNNLFGLRTISLRYFNVYGPRQNPSGVYASLIPRSIELITKNQAPQISGDGTQTRDFVFVKDVVRANIFAGTTNNPLAFGEVFNVGSGKSHSVNDVLKTIIGDKEISPEYFPVRIEPQKSLADISKIKQTLGWFPKYTFERGMRETLKWFNQRK